MNEEALRQFIFTGGVVCGMIIAFALIFVATHRPGHGGYNNRITRKD